MNHRRRRRANGQRHRHPSTPVEGFEELWVNIMSESMRRLALNRLPPTLPERPGEQYHPLHIHPHDGAMSGGALWYPERPGQRSCKQFLKNGSCNYGLRCKFNHPRQGDGPVQRVPLNDSGYPLQMGVSVPSGFASQYMHQPYSPMFVPPQMVPNPGWTCYPAPINPLASSSAPVYQGAYPMYAAGGPSQPHCLTYMRTGKCVFRSACGLHHPPERITSCALSPIGLPLRPGAPPCGFYVLHGSCDFGSTCIFDHPYVPSASSSEPAQSRRSRPERNV